MTTPTPAPPATPPAELAVDFFDGRTAKAHAVRMHVSGGTLYLRGDGVARGVPLADVQWPERTERGRRVAHLADGGALHGADGAAWDAWARASGLRETRVVTVQQSWGLTLAAALVLGVLMVAGYLWGLPVAARALVGWVPPTVDQSIGSAVFESIEAEWLKPSALPAEQQQRLREAFRQATEAAYREGERPAYQLHFRSGRIGPNAFALPGGHIVMTDDLVKLVDGDAAVVVGVLGHELGHVRHRHGMRMLVKAAFIGMVSSLAFGDFSGILAAAPALLGTAAYSRDFEREADHEAVRVLRAAGLSPLAMVTLFERLADVKAGAGPAASASAASGAASTPASQAAPGDRARPAARDESGLGIAFSSHPADAERIRFFRAAAGETGAASPR